MSVEKRPKPELPFKPMDSAAPREVNFNQILTGASRSFNFGTEEENCPPYDLHEIEGQYDLTDQDNGPVIMRFKDGTLYYSQKSVGRQDVEKIRDDISLELAKKIYKGEELTDEEITLIEEGKI